MCSAVTFWAASRPCGGCGQCGPMGLQVGARPAAQPWSCMWRWQAAGPAWGHGVGGGHGGTQKSPSCLLRWSRNVYPTVMYFVSGNSHIGMRENCMWPICFSPLPLCGWRLAFPEHLILNLGSFITTSLILILCEAPWHPPPCVYLWYT